MNLSKTVVGVDTAKRVFQLHWIEQETGEIVSLQLKREKFLEHFANRASCLIGMGSVRRISALGTKTHGSGPPGQAHAGQDRTSFCWRQQERRA